VALRIWSAAVSYSVAACSGVLAPEATSENRWLMSLLPSIWAQLGLAGVALEFSAASKKPF